jgi:hypothetical protein
MINLKVWESFNGTQTPIAEMDTRHCINAIQVIERNDPRYGVKHGAALPALLAEVERRATRGEFSWIKNDDEAARFIASRKPASAPTKRSDWASPYMGFDPGGMAGHVFVADMHIGRAVTKTVEQRLAEVERKTHGATTIALVDDSAGRAHRRIDTLEEQLRGFRPASSSVNARLSALEKATGPDLDVRTEDLYRALNKLTTRVEALETPKPKARKASKAKTSKARK